MMDEWIIGAKAITAYLRLSSWKSTKRWIRRYGAPLQHWIDGRVAFYKPEIDAWLLETSRRMAEMEKAPRKGGPPDPRGSKPTSPSPGTP